MFPPLTNGAINRIFDGEDVENAVVQVLGREKFPGIGNDLYRLLISDGVIINPYAILGIHLNHMIEKKLEQYTIVQVEKCVCNQTRYNTKVIFLLSLTVLVPGKKVSKKLGNPVVSTIGNLSLKVTNNVPAATGTTASYLNLNYYIDRILNGENVSNAVVQILGCKKIPGDVIDRYRLHISDGVTDFSFVMLGTQLNHMVANKELEKFTILRINKCVCKQVQADRKVIILLNLTVLVPGNKINAKLDSPEGISTQVESAAATNGTKAVNAVAMKKYPNLNAGIIHRIFKGIDTANAIVQILGCERIPGVVDDRYNILLSDGVNACSYVILGTHLNHMVTNKELEKYAIVEIDKFACEKVRARWKLIVILRLTVLVPGNEVQRKLGNPVDIFS